MGAKYHRIKTHLLPYALVELLLTTEVKLSWDKTLPENAKLVFQTQILPKFPSVFYNGS
jgi:hypothetical protein